MKPEAQPLHRQDSRQVKAAGRRDCQRKGYMADAPPTIQRRRHVRILSNRGQPRSVSEHAPCIIAGRIDSSGGAWKGHGGAAVGVAAAVHGDLPASVVEYGVVHNPAQQGWAQVVPLGTALRLERRETVFAHTKVQIARFVHQPYDINADRAEAGQSPEAVSATADADSDRACPAGQSRVGLGASP